jgi:alkaline phosphatase D
MCAGVPNAWRVTGRPHLTDPPFTLGVASGDPTSESCVIWTRLAPRPFEPESGMEGHRTVIGWEVAHDEAFSRVVRQGRYTCAPELNYSVHVDVQGLEPDRWYFYRFTTNEGASPVGRMRTTPAAGADTPLDFAFVSCNHWEQGLFTAFDHLAREELDLVAHLGDYIYEYASNDTRVRHHHGFEILSLAEYRQRYAQYKSDPALQAVHHRCPWVVTWDDHEVDNNYASLVGENVFESEEQMRNRRAAAYQAWWENQPVRVPRPRSWADLTIRRSAGWGRLIRFWVLDTRQYRSDQPCGDGRKPVPCGDWGNPEHTLLGDEQERWLVEGMGASDARWQVLAQQVMMAPFDGNAEQGVTHAMDPWSGYPVARDRLLRAIGDRAAGRTVVITGDIHSSWVNDLHAGFAEPGRPVIATEFVGTSISSAGDGADHWSFVPPALPQNPHVNWHNARRGYVRCRVTEEEWRADYRLVPFVTRPGAPVETASSWRCERDRPGVERVDGG